MIEAYLSKKLAIFALDNVLLNVRHQTAYYQLALQGSRESK